MNANRATAIQAMGGVVALTLQKLPQLTLAMMSQMLTCQMALIEVMTRLA